MSELNPEYLCLDIGNSRVKYALITEYDIVDWGNLADDAHLRRLLEKCKAVYIASVGQTTRLAQVIEIISLSRRPYQLLHTSAKAFNLTCAYAEPAKLGLDRWLVMLGARRHTACKAFAVMDFGTAITCDFVDQNGQHQGGWICPGIHLMRQSLRQNTAQVTINQKHWYTGSIGMDTEECVDSGCLTLAKGIINRAKLWLKDNSSDYEIFVCGGDSEQFLPDFESEVRHIPELIFYGMMEFISKKP